MNDNKDKESVIIKIFRSIVRFITILFKEFVYSLKALFRTWYKLLLLILIGGFIGLMIAQCCMAM